MGRKLVAAVLGLPAVVLLAWAAESPAAPAVPAGLPALVWPGNNSYSVAKAELGRYLYFDRRLSADGTISCATCHDPSHGYTDGAAISTGIRGQKGTRSAPTILNRAYSQAQFWDGRSASLEEQAKDPMTNPIEMGNTHEAVVASLRQVPGYRVLFAKAFGSPEIDLARVVGAIACFERTLLSGNSPYDRYKAGDRNALTAEQVRGMSVFFDKAACDRCHEGANFTLNAFANTGVGSDAAEPDPGRFAVTQDPRDRGVFKVPTLREIEHTAPYMHDGSVKTLEDVVEFYDKGGIANRNLDSNIRPLHLTAQQKSALVAFLKSLSGEGWQSIEAPRKFPE